MRAKGSRSLVVGSLALVALGIVLLLNNFLLLTNFNVAALSPLLLVLLGAAILLRGDLLPGTDARSFGITRGSVESATLEISAGEIDVIAQPFQREGRLIAGQYALNSRPLLDVQDNHATLRMDRSATPWLSFANWSLNLARDLPWSIFATSHVGQAQFDLSGLIVQSAVIATGIGDIRLTCPQEAIEPIVLRSAVGNIHLLSPYGSSVRVTVSGSRLFHVHVDANRYEAQSPGVYAAREPAADQPMIDVYISGTFGDAYLA